MKVDIDGLKTHLLKLNYWWETGKITPEDMGIPRGTYLERIEASLDLERVICLSGVRRCGKTTLMFQFISDRLDRKEDPKHFVMVKIDEVLEKIDGLEDIISAYTEITGIDPREEMVYFFFDEMQYLDDWPIKIKQFTERRYKSKFFVSGSSKTLLYHNASESLTGRIRFIDVTPLSFGEFLSFCGEDLKLSGDAKKDHMALSMKKEHFKRRLEEYLSVGGFPEWFKIKDMAKWQRVLTDDYLSLILYKDIVHVFKVRNPLLLEHLVRDIAVFSTERFSYASMSQRMDVDRESLKQYLYYIEASGIANIAEVYSKNKKSREGSEKKIYFFDEGMRQAVFPNTDVPRCIENIVAAHLIARGRNAKPFFIPYYWKNGHEVDFIFDIGSKVIPFEVKYRNDPEDPVGMLEFLEKFKMEKGVIVTKDTFGQREYRGKRVLFIPAWLFLLMDPAKM